jgi:hypothetical protein
LQGAHLYDQVNLDGHAKTFTRPFLFNIRPTQLHPHFAHPQRFSRVLSMYDNAGEHYQPGMDSTGSPVTQHLGKSRVLMFLFDPTQDPHFREKCKAFSQDPQLGGSKKTQRQETLLTEAGLRLRRYANIAPNAKHNRPLLVILPKSDVWGQLLDEDVASEPILPSAVAGKLAGVDVRRIERVSGKIRTLLLRLTPELVGTVEDLCEHVVYLPVSSLGRSPEESPTSKGLFIRPRDIAPRWVTVPVLYMFAKWATGLVASNISGAKTNSSTTVPQASSS